MPTFSIITVCYNEAAHIRETLDSIICQTCKDYELIVVDGGSTDGTKNILEQYADHFVWWCSEPDKGIYNGMNKGVSHATGEYVIFMNGGDCFHDEHVLNQVMRHGLTADIMEGNAVNKNTQQPIRQHIDNLEIQLITDCLSHQSTFIRRYLLNKFPYDERYKIAADWKFWLQTLLNDKHSYEFLSDIVVADMDVTGITYSQLDRNKRERNEILAEFLPSGFATPLISILNEHHELTHNILVNYAIYLDQYSPKSYQLLRKIAKRLVKLTKHRQQS